MFQDGQRAALIDQAPLPSSAAPRSVRGAGQGERRPPPGGDGPPTRPPAPGPGTERWRLACPKTHQVHQRASGPDRPTVTHVSYRDCIHRFGEGLSGQHGAGPRLPWSLGREAHGTAPHSTVPAEASGTFNPLCKVLCILQSLYLCAIGPTAVLHLATDTCRTSNCSPKQIYSWIQTAAPGRPGPTTEYGTVSLRGGPFQGTFLGPRPALAHTARSIQPTASDNHSVAGCTAARGQRQMGSVRVEPWVLPVHSPLLEQSLLLGIPPLSDMLKFSG